ncbi:MAG TPA: Crp/Fnr family transcriptional regulator [Urbifossiella sp.]|jgi:CRP-like cAMP-binding protein|nr:Crp/Fnr family transcriptional regulator [Urbifossiella sp.]
MTSLPPENRLLSALPPHEFDRLTARMTDVSLGHKDMIYRPGGPIEHVYFPRSGMLSAVVVMEGGETAEVAGIGREGMTGASTFLGATHSQEQVFCQVSPCECRKLPAAEFAAEVARGGALRDVVYRYLRGVLTVSARQTACNALHPNDERLAMWLLRCRDAAGADEFNLTHEFMATMLGVRRATVTVTASTLQSAGLISYRSGKVKVLDPAGLETVACECYPVIRDALRPATR